MQFQSTIFFLRQRHRNGTCVLAGRRRRRGVRRGQRGGARRSGAGEGEAAQERDARRAAHLQGRLLGPLLRLPAHVQADGRAASRRRLEATGRFAPRPSETPPEPAPLAPRAVAPLDRDRAPVLRGTTAPRVARRRRYKCQCAECKGCDGRAKAPENKPVGKEHFTRRVVGPKARR